MKLEGREWAPLTNEHGSEMFDRMQQRIGPGAGGRRLLPAKLRAPIIEPLAQLALEAIHRLQRKRQAQFFSRRLGTKPSQEFHQPRPQLGSEEGMSRQHVGQHEGKGPSATAALAAVGTKHPLAPQGLAAGVGRIVAAQKAVPVQRLSLSAAGAALLLERKRASLSAGTSRTK